jgi:hypothetical protein
MSISMPRELTRNDRSVGVERNFLSVQQPSSSVACQPKDHGEQASTLMLRVSFESTREIDRLVDDLKGLREKLKNQADRIQSDIAEFVSLSQSTVQLSKIVSDSMAHMKGVSQTGRASVA